MSAREHFATAMSLAGHRYAQADRAERGCALATSAARWFFDLDAAARALVEPHLAAFLRLRETDPAEASARAWAAYDALEAERPKAFPRQEGRG